DEGVDGSFHRSPGARAAIARQAVAGPAFLADDLSRALELARQALVRGHDLVERVGHLAGEPGLIAREPHGEIPITHRLQRAQQPAHVQSPFLGAVPAVGAACARLTFHWLWHQQAPQMSAPGARAARRAPWGAVRRTREMTIDSRSESCTPPPHATHPARRRCVMASTSSAARAWLVRTSASV